MFVKTKRRIVFAVVFSLLVLMTVTLTTIYVSNRAALDRESGEMLRTFCTSLVYSLLKYSSFMKETPFTPSVISTAPKP